MKIVILSTQRSGSTLVCDDFFGTSKLGRPTEHYLELWDKNTLDDIEVYFDTHAKTSNGIIAVKIMANQLARIDNLYKKVGGRPYRFFFIIKRDNPYKYFFEQYKKAIFFRVYREDKVAQAVSLIFSERTDVFHLVDDSEKLKGLVGKETTDQNVRNVSFEYDGDEIKRRLEFIKKNELILDHFCEVYRIKPHIIKYEDILEGNGYVKDIGKRIGIKQVKPSSRTLKKIGGLDAQYWIDNYKKEENIG